jgi:hypothetical protein
MTVTARIALRALPLLALAVVTSGSTCNDESGSTGGGTTAARRIEAPPLEGGCPDEDPVATLDLNRDGQPDFAVFPEDGGTCRAGDLNFDGTYDIYRHRDAAGTLLREEADGDFDLQLDAVAVYSGAADPYREEFDTNWDGHVDLWVELQRDCAFARAGSSTCTTDCATDWCRPRNPAPSTEEGAEPPPTEALPSAAVVLYRDNNADGIWETAEVILGEHPICTAFNTNAPGDTRESVHPEVVEIYKPGSARLGRPDIDFLHRDYLDLQGNPIVRCEDSDGVIIPCPAACGQ